MPSCGCSDHQWQWQRKQAHTSPLPAADRQSVETKSRQVWQQWPQPVPSDMTEWSNHPWLLLPEMLSRHEYLAPILAQSVQGLSPRSTIGHQISVLVFSQEKYSCTNLVWFYLLFVDNNNNKKQLPYCSVIIRLRYMATCKTMGLGLNVNAVMLYDWGNNKMKMHHAIYPINQNQYNSGVLRVD